VEWTREAERSALRSEFEERLADSSSLAFRVARGVLRNDADAEDVAQEALVKAFRNFEELRERNRFRAWLVRVSFRLALDRLRSSKRRGIREAEWIREQERTRPAESETSHEFQQRLERAMAELPEKCASCFCSQRWTATRSTKSQGCSRFPLAQSIAPIFARKKLAEKLRCLFNLQQIANTRGNER